MRSKLRDGLIALSIANLTFIRTWNEFLMYSAEQSFFFKNLPTLTQSAALTLNVLILSAILFGVIRLTRMVAARWSERLGVAVALLILIPPLNAIGSVVAQYAPEYAPQRLLEATGLARLLIVLTAVAVLTILLRWPRRTLAAGGLIAVQFVPLLPLELAGITWHAVTDNKVGYSESAVAGRLAPRQDEPTILWLLIDELDYRLLFEARPRDIRVPNFERLRSEVLSASNALPPNSAQTLFSVPSLLTGERLDSIKTMGPNVLTGVPDGGARQGIQGPGTVFGAVRAAGINTSVVGWYLPYCRLFAEVLSNCSWYDFGMRLNVEDDSLLSHLLNQAQASFETSTHSPFPISVRARHRIFNASHIRSDALRLLSAPHPGFVYIHHMATHAPYVYDRFTGDFTKVNAPASGYFDALVWADRVLGEIRAAMEMAGSWNAATVLVTADHSLRHPGGVTDKYDPRVPWLVKLPHQRAAVAYARPMRTLVTRSFLEAVIAGRVLSGAAAVRWLDGNGK